MSRMNRYMAILVLAIGLACVGVGVTFVVQSQVKSNWIEEAMRQEEVTLGLTDEAKAAGEVVDSAAEAQRAADTIKAHRQKIAPTYSDLTGGEGFDPANPDHVRYMQALNMENYLYTSVMGFGLTTVVLAAGAFMIMVGIALSAIGLGMARHQQAPAVSVNQ